MPAATPAAPVLILRTAALLPALPLLLIQAGQFIGARADFVPDQICRKLCLLQDQVPPMSPARAKQVGPAPPATQQNCAMCCSHAHAATLLCTRQVYAAMVCQAFKSCSFIEQN